MEFKVLKGCRIVLSLTNLLERQKFHVGRFTFPNILYSIIFMIPLNLSLSLMIWFCFDEKFNLMKTSNAISISLGIVQIELIFICLACQKPLITNMLSHFENIVFER